MTTDTESAAAPSTAYPPGNVIHQPAGTGPTIWFGDAIYTFKAEKDNTNGVMTLAEASVPPGSGPPPHIHPHADEGFYILGGEIEFLNGESTFIAGEGDFVYVPRGTRHRFRNVGLHVARLLFFFTAAGMEGFFRELGTEAVKGESPTPFTPAQRKRIVEVAPKYDLKLAP
ncbi:cupin domain-containing protein [Streptomyces sp. NPDC059582]|uniref:cupin domain-containing protein n=1 Tax=Streptomyces sp. NPDC059582 TaxID=3346875 RepID=UPI0036BB1A79